MRPRGPSTRISNAMSITPQKVRCHLLPYPAAFNYDSAISAAARQNEIRTECRLVFVLSTVVRVWRFENRDLSDSHTHLQPVLGSLFILLNARRMRSRSRALYLKKMLTLMKYETTLICYSFSTTVRNFKVP